MADPLGINHLVGRAVQHSTQPIVVDFETRLSQVDVVCPPIMLYRARACTNLFRFSAETAARISSVSDRWFPERLSVQIYRRGSKTAEKGGVSASICCDSRHFLPKVFAVIYGQNLAAEALPLDFSPKSFLAA